LSDYSWVMPRLAPALPLALSLLALAACGKAKTASDLPADIDQSLNPAFLAAFGQDAPAPHTITRGGKAVDVAYSPAAIARPATAPCW